MCLQEEMFKQGDREKNLDMLISPLCDRTKPGVSTVQTDFFNFVAIDMYKLIANEFVEITPILDGVLKNYNIWQDKYNNL
jgi:hypothetical protein